MPTLQPFEEVKILNTRFHKLTVCELIDYVTSAARSPRKTIVTYANVRTMNLAADLPWFRDFLNRADLVFCDGFGVLLGAKILGANVRSQHRMTCPDYIETLAQECERNNLSIYFLAGKPGVVDLAMHKLRTVAPQLKMAGHHGYFDKNSAENDAVVAEIDRFKPDILYLGFGMPLQERWILDNGDRIDTRVFLALGACLDFYSGEVDRGPRWMTDNGLEWLSRLVAEPSKLWARYIVGNPRFLARIFKQKLFGTFTR